MAARDRQLRTPEAIDAFIERDLPFSVRGTFGGNTSCVELGTGGNEYMICDLGRVREFGAKMMMQHGPARPQTYNVFLSHVHWDHIMGFPFFTPAYIPGDRFIFQRAPIDARGAAAAAIGPCFPVLFESLGATIEFIELEPARISRSPGSRFLVSGSSTKARDGYRFTKNGKVIVYSDCEHKASVLIIRTRSSSSATPTC